eukprot:6204534-Pleurochrysis_carterae.AAC.2
MKGAGCERMRKWQRKLRNTWHSPVSPDAARAAADDESTEEGAEAPADPGADDDHRGVPVVECQRDGRDNRAEARDAAQHAHRDHQAEVRHVAATQAT